MIFFGESRNYWMLLFDMTDKSKTLLAKNKIFMKNRSNKTSKAFLCVSASRQLLLDNSSCIVLLPAIRGSMHCSRSLFPTRPYRFHPWNRTYGRPALICGSSFNGAISCRVGIVHRCCGCRYVVTADSASPTQFVFSPWRALRLREKFYFYYEK
jgi:hypothetical protein